MSLPRGGSVGNRTVSARRTHALLHTAPASKLGPASEQSGRAASRRNAQVIFKPDQFQPVVEWLMMNRGGLDVLIHPLTEDSVDDHRVSTRCGWARRSR